MKRDPRLLGLSSQHHRALVLALSLAQEPLDWSCEKGIAFGARFDAELEPHFLIEDEVLLLPTHQITVQDSAKPKHQDRDRSGQATQTSCGNRLWDSA